MHILKHFCKLFKFQELEAKLDALFKENKRLVEKVAEVICEKQDLEDTIRRKNDLLKFKVSSMGNFEHKIDNVFNRL